MGGIYNLPDVWNNIITQRLTKSGTGVTPGGGEGGGGGGYFWIGILCILQNHLGERDGLK